MYTPGSGSPVLPASPSCAVHPILRPGSKTTRVGGASPSETLIMLTSFSARKARSSRAVSISCSSVERLLPPSVMVVMGPSMP